MKLLFFGDVVGLSGCTILQAQLRKLKAEFGADVCVVNGENSAEGNGITIKSARKIGRAHV